MRGRRRIHDAFAASGSGSARGLGYRRKTDETTRLNRSQIVTGWRHPAGCLWPVATPRQTARPAPADNPMIEHADVDQRQRVAQPRGDQLIRLTRLRNAAGSDFGPVSPLFCQSPD
jgi:hypothetical protein